MQTVCTNISSLIQVEGEPAIIKMLIPYWIGQPWSDRTITIETYCSSSLANAVDVRRIKLKDFNCFRGGRAYEVLNYRITVDFFKNYRNTVIKFLYKYRYRSIFYQKLYFSVTVGWLKYRILSIFYSNHRIAAQKIGLYRIWYTIWWFGRHPAKDRGQFFKKYGRQINSYTI